MSETQVFAKLTDKSSMNPKPQDLRLHLTCPPADYTEKPQSEKWWKMTHLKIQVCGHFFDIDSIHQIYLDTSQTLGHYRVAHNQVFKNNLWRLWSPDERFYSLSRPLFTVRLIIYRCHVCIVIDGVTNKQPANASSPYLSKDDHLNGL